MVQPCSGIVEILNKVDDMVPMIKEYMWSDYKTIKGFLEPVKLHFGLLPQY